MKKRCNKIPVLPGLDNLAPHAVLESSSFGARDVNYLSSDGKRQVTVNGLNGEHVLNGHLPKLSSGHPSLGFATFQALNPSFAQEDDGLRLEIHHFHKKKVNKKMHKTLAIIFSLSLMAGNSYTHFTQPYAPKEHKTSFPSYAHLQHESAQLIFFNL